MNKKWKVMTARFPGHGGRSHYRDVPEDLETASDSSSSSSSSSSSDVESPKKKSAWTPLPDECSALISVGKEHFKDQYLKALIGSFDRIFSSATLIVAGTLQRYNIAIIKGQTPMQAYADAKKQEDLFIALVRRYAQQLRLLKKALNVVQSSCNFKYIPWGTYKNHTDFEARLFEVNQLLQTDPFKRALAETVGAFSEKHLHEDFFLRSRYKAGKNIPETQPTAAFFRECFGELSKEVKARFSEKIFKKNGSLRPDIFLREYFELAPKEERTVFTKIFKTNSEIFLVTECAAMWQWEGLIVYPSGASPILQAMTDYINKTRDKARQLDESASVPKNISWQTVKRKDVTVKNVQNIIDAAKEEDSSFLDTALLQLPDDKVKQLIGANNPKGKQRRQKSVSVITDLGSKVSFYTATGLTPTTIQQHQNQTGGGMPSKQEQTEDWFRGVTVGLQVKFTSVLDQQPDERKAFLAQLLFLKGMISGLQGELRTYSSPRHSISGQTFGLVS